MSAAEPSATPGRDDVDSITAVAQDYVKAIWSATEWGDPPITTKALATRFGTSAANVSDTLKRLATQGLIEYAPYKPVRLTETGARLAVTMVRRHRLIETFLVRTLGYSWDEIHDEAELLEHAASGQLIERIATLLGEPDADPHGDPIPSSDGTTRLPTGAVRLDEVLSGRYVVTRISDAEPGDLAAAGALGLRPGQFVEIRQRMIAESDAGAGTVRTTMATVSGTHDLPARLAVALWVLPAPG